MQEKWLKTSIDRVRDRFVKNLQLDLRHYLRGTYAALEDPTINNHGRLTESVHASVTSVTDGLEARIETIEALCSTSAIGD